MKSYLLALAAVAALTFVPSARAGTIDTFTFGGDGTQLTGSFTAVFGGSTTTFSGNVAIENGAYTFNAATDVVGFAPAADGPYGVFLFQNASSDGLFLGISFVPADPLTPDVFLLCSTANTCGTSLFSGVISADSGTIFEPINTGYAVITESTTPEPSSIALLGTGLLALAGIGRRRFLHA